MTNFERFQNRYAERLREAIAKNPACYTTPIEGAADLAAKMTRSLAEKRANLSDTARKVAKDLGVKPTYGAIEAYLAG